MVERKSVIEMGLNLKLVAISCFLFFPPTPSPGSAVNSLCGLRKIFLPSVIFSCSLIPRFELDQKSNSVASHVKNLTWMYDVGMIELSM